MAMSNTVARLLVKTSVSGQSVQLTTTDGHVANFTPERLSGGAPGGSPSGATISAWQVWTLTSPLTEPTLWDLCHQLLSGKLSVDGGALVDGASVIDFAEPDVPQNWSIGTNHPLALAAASPGAPAAPEDDRFPTEPDPYWFRDADHAQFDAIQPETAPIDAADRVRVAHLDTGYDPNHASLPIHLNHVLEANCVDGMTVGDGAAVDDSTGFLVNLGHGTGTLAILAGSAVEGHALGGAPDADVVPVRVANSVVLFFNSAITRAFSYILNLCGDPATRVHVVTMSMGGVPSYAWTDLVNQLYDAGVFMVTASGDNFSNLPIHTTVYPALFNRVVAACGVMANGAPYADLPYPEMAGNYGPPSKMATALSAYTPNVPWARYGSGDVVDFNGSGTSSATPQIAAAAAQWIQQHKAEWDVYPEGWMRVEAVRKALFESATQEADTLHFGCGLLRAADALDVVAAPAADLVAQPPDTLIFPLAGLIPAAAELGTNEVHRQMLQVEALQLAYTSTTIERALPGWAVGAAITPATQPADRPRRQPTSHASAQQQARAALLAHTGASRALKDALQMSKPSKPSNPPTSPSSKNTENPKNAQNAQTSHDSRHKRHARKAESAKVLA